MTAFEDAVRRYFDAPKDSVVTSHWNQSGDDGCDTCGYGRDPSSIELTVIQYSLTPKGNPTSRKPPVFYAHEEFTTLPDLWAALFPDEDTP